MNRFRVAELQKRAVNFAENYDDSNDRGSIILVPGGMGSRLLQSATVFRDGVEFPDVLQLKLREIWLSLAAFLRGDIAQLHMTPQGEDKDRRPIIASGELSSIIKEYDGTEKHFSAKANYAAFGYDWRRLPEEEFMDLFEFLQRIRNEVTARGFKDPLPRLTLFGHSMGGLIIKLFINYLVDSGEDTRKWFYRFVSAGTPFYGTLEIVEKLMYPGTLPPAGAQPPTADVEVADVTEVVALIDEVKAGSKPESDLVDAPLPIHRCLAYSLGLT